MGLSLPIPKTKGFGEYSDNNVATLLAEKANDSSFWQLKSIINQTLHQVDSAYWDLAYAHRSLAVVIEKERLSAEHAKRMRRKLGLGVVTRYDSLQADTELASAKLAVESAKNNVINASLALSLLLEDSVASEVSSALYVPVGFSDALVLEESADYDYKKLLQTGAEHNPDLWVAKIAIESGNINYEHSKSQALVDLSLSGSISG